MPYNKNPSAGHNRKDLMNAGSKFKSTDTHNRNFEALIKKDISPFKINLDLERDRGVSIPSFLPSFHEHK